MTQTILDYRRLGMSSQKIANIISQMSIPQDSRQRLGTIERFIELFSNTG